MLVQFVRAYPNQLAPPPGPSTHAPYSAHHMRGISALGRTRSEISSASNCGGDSPNSPTGIVFYAILRLPMTVDIDAYKRDLNILEQQGSKMYDDLLFQYLDARKKLDESDRALANEVRGTFRRDYQRWYTVASAVVRQLIPHRIVEFDNLYMGDGKDKPISVTTYNIQDWLNGIRPSVDYTGQKLFDDLGTIMRRFETQLGILKSANERFESSLLDMGRIVQADLFDSELDSARELLKHGFGRGAAAVAGVVLEKHLSQVDRST